jgi:NodT family efflux transporter outer membrane factor (OMF) lipoprotein
MPNRLVNVKLIPTLFKNIALLGLPLVLLAGCASVGPDFEVPESPVVEEWLTADPVFSRDEGSLREWWKNFNDPVLNNLIDVALNDNLVLQVAGIRILQARAQLGIATGNQYPQQQSVGGSVAATQISENSPNFFEFADNSYNNYLVGFDATWEIDFWGRYRRGIESAQANLDVTVADYQDALVAVTAEVARTYIGIRTLAVRRRLAIDNVSLQRESLRVAESRFNNGATTELDVQQAKSNLADTQALVPSIERSLRIAKNALAVLLGMLPGQVDVMLGEGLSEMSEIADTVSTGLPADLLRRRPDVRMAEYQAASQSALIGLAKTDMYPRFFLFGSIGFNVGTTNNNSSSDLFNSESLTYSAGPGFSWNILNYGRLKNSVRVQDARFQASLVNYQDTVLRAYQEAEDAMASFTGKKEEASYRAQSAQAAQRSTELANTQYREGAVDFQRVVDSERFLVAQQDQWVKNVGEVALSMVALYKALGGGWEISAERPFVSESNLEAMDERTNWGGMLDEVGD